MKIQKFIKFIQNRRDLKDRTKAEYIKLIKLVPKSIIKGKSVPKAVRYFEKRGLKRKSVSSYISILRQYWIYANQNFRNKRYKTHKRSEVLRPAMTKNELNKMFKRSDKQLRAVLLLLYRTGLRINELLNSAVFVDSDKVIFDFLGKARWIREKIVIRSDDEVLQAVRIFQEMDIIEKSYNEIYKEFITVRDSCKIDKNKTLHSIRHLFAKEKYEKYDINTARDMMRHNDRNSIYAYVNDVERITYIE